MRNKLWEELTNNLYEAKRVGLSKVKQAKMEGKEMRSVWTLPPELSHFFSGEPNTLRYTGNLA